MGMKINERFAVLSGVVPQAVNATNKQTTRTLASLYERIDYIVQTGTMDTTLDAAIYQALDSSGTSEKVVTGKSLVQVTSAGGSKRYSLEVQTNELDIENGFVYVSCKVTSGSGTSGNYVNVTPIAYASRYKPVSGDVTQKI